MAKSAKIIDIATRKRRRVTVNRPTPSLERARAELRRAGIAAPQMQLPTLSRAFLAQSFKHFFSKSIEAALKRRASAWPAKPTR